jgi:poly-gamma-glutamate capsule biosynthesis protein CapA/YwtB (metallophosphatase superfamily)
MNTVTLLLAGDVMTGRGIDQVLAQPGDPTLHESCVRDARDYVRLAEGVNGPIERSVAPGYVWGDALAEMQRIGPRLRIVNLETAVTRLGAPLPAKGIHYRMHPGNVGVLTAGGIDACVLANNHVLDWGREGLDETLRTLRGAGLRTAGAGSDGESAWSPASFDLGAGRRLQLFACAAGSSGVPDDWSAGPGRSGVALLPDLSDSSADQLADHAERHRRAGDRALLSIHWGGNWGTEIPRGHRRFARRLLERGAFDLIHGHSSHHPLAMEVHRGRLILYGCGDLINDYEGIATHGTLRSDVGCLYFVMLALSDGALRGVEIRPMRLRRFRLERADADARVSVERLFNEGGLDLGTRVEARGDGALALRWEAGPARPA